MDYVQEARHLYEHVPDARVDLMSAAALISIAESLATLAAKVGGPDYDPDTDHPGSRATLAELLADYDEWAAEWSDYGSRDGTPDGPTPDQWAANDDWAVNLLTRFAGAVRNAGLA